MPPDQKVAFWFNNYWKFNFPMRPDVGLLIGREIGRSVGQFVCWFVWHNFIGSYNIYDHLLDPGAKDTKREEREVLILIPQSEILNDGYEPDNIKLTNMIRRSNAFQRSRNSNLSNVNLRSFDLEC